MSIRPYRLGQWLPSDRKVNDEWLANLIQEVKVKCKDKLDLISAIDSPDENEEEAWLDFKQRLSRQKIDTSIYINQLEICWMRFAPTPRSTCSSIKCSGSSFISQTLQKKEKLTPGSV